MKSELSLRLAKLPIKLDAIHIGIDTWPGDYKDYCDHWKVTITYQERSLTTDFYADLGCRKVANHITRSTTGYFNDNTGEYRLIDEAAREDWLILQKPELADVMNALFIAASACNKTFDDWCGSLGYNNDSIKVLNKYIMHQRDGAAIRKVLGPKLADELSNLGY